LAETDIKSLVSKAVAVAMDVKDVAKRAEKAEKAEQGKESGKAEGDFQASQW